MTGGGGAEKKAGGRGVAGAEGRRGCSRERERKQEEKGECRGERESKEEGDANGRDCESLLRE